MTVDGDEFELRDLSSKNGTFVRNKRVECSPIQIGQTVRIGPVELRVESVRQEDTWLSVAADGRGRGTASALSETSTLVFSDEVGTRITRQWLEVLDHVTFEIGVADVGAVGGAIAVLCRDLGLPGAALVQLPAEGSAVIAASFGDLGGDLPVKEIRSDRPSLAQRGVAVVREDEAEAVAWTVVVEPSGPVLALRGEVPDAEVVAPFLRVIHRMLTQSSARSHPRATAEQRSELILQFPPDYLPGESSAMASVYRELASVADSDLPLLLIGETGVGKECLAETVHLSSSRKSGPFLPINCAAIPSDLLEAELFGIARGVATGVVERPGRLALAEGGTVFLDEIGDMSPALQAKLLRALEEGVVQRVGGPREATDVRIIAATNTDLDRKVETGEFRRDLYYRLAGLVVTIPPLRQRQQDVGLLVEHFFHRVRAESGCEVDGLTYGAMKRLVARRWPGNVRELRHAVRRLVLQCPEGRAIDSSMVEGIGEGGLTRGGHAKGELAVDFSAWESLKLEETCKGLVREAMRRSEGNQTAAAALLGITRSSLRRRLIKLFPGESFGRGSDTQSR